VIARRSQTLVALALVSALLPSSVVAAPSSEESPVELIRQGRHLEAAKVLERQYQDTADAALLFAKATALRRGGDCRGAIGELERFIDTHPPSNDVDEARRVIAVCEEILADEPRPVPPPVVVLERAPEPIEGESQAPWGRDVAGGVLLGSGVAVAIGGAVVLGVGASRRQARRESEAGFERRRQSVRAMTAVGASMLAAGAVFIIGSIVRYAVVARR